MSKIIHGGDIVLAAITDRQRYVAARKEADKLAAEHYLKVADMPMLMQAMDNIPEVRKAFLNDWFDIITGEYHGLREGKRSYEAWHSVGSLATAEGIERNSMEKVGYGFMLVNDYEWAAVGNGDFNGQNIVRIHIDDARKGIVPEAGTPYTIFARLDSDNLNINPSGKLGYDQFMRDDRILMAVGSPEGREILAKILFGRVEEGWLGRNLFGSYHKINDVSFEVEAKGRLLFLGSNYDGGLYGSSNLYINGRFVGVRERSEHLAPKAHSIKTVEEAVKAVLESGKPMEEILKEIYLKEQQQKERISRLEQKIADSNIAEKKLADIKQSLADIKGQINGGSITIEGKKYNVVTAEEAQCIEKIRKGQPIKTQNHEYASTRILTPEEKKKKKVLEFE